MLSTLTLRSTTRFKGETVSHGTVLRVPQDVDLVTARRWVGNGIATVGGEYAASGAAKDREEVPFEELEKELQKEQDERIGQLATRSKEALLDMCRSRLIDVSPRTNKEELARILVEAPE